jgi:hypothetical protein
LGAQLSESATVRVEIALQGQNSDDHARQPSPQRNTRGHRGSSAAVI